MMPVLLTIKIAAIAQGYRKVICYPAKETAAKHGLVRRGNLMPVEDPLNLIDRCAG
jgi:hypothetical protein